MTTPAARLPCWGRGLKSADRQKFAYPVVRATSRGAAGPFRSASSPEGLPRVPHNPGPPAPAPAGSQGPLGRFRTARHKNARQGNQASLSEPHIANYRLLGAPHLRIVCRAGSPRCQPWMGLDPPNFPVRKATKSNYPAVSIFLLIHPFLIATFVLVLKASNEGGSRMAG